MCTSPWVQAPGKKGSWGTEFSVSLPNSSSVCLPQVNESTFPKMEKDLSVPFHIRHSVEEKSNHNEKVKIILGAIYR